MENVNVTFNPSGVDVFSKSVRGGSGSGSKSNSIIPPFIKPKKKVLYLEQPKPDSVELAAMLIVHTRYKNV